MKMKEVVLSGFTLEDTRKIDIDVEEEYTLALAQRIANTLHCDVGSVRTSKGVTAVLKGDERR